MTLSVPLRLTCLVVDPVSRPQQRARRGRIVWTDEDSAGASQPEDGSFPWLASLFLRQSSGEAYFMCAATILTSRVLVSAAHCFNDRSVCSVPIKFSLTNFHKITQYHQATHFFLRYRDTDWFVRVGDNFMASRDPSEQTFQVRDLPPTKAKATTRLI